MTLRMQWRRPIRTWVALALGFSAVVLSGGATAGAAPAPTPATPSRTAPAPLQVVLPGLLTVSVDLPKIKIEVLDGGGSTAPGSRAAAQTPPAAAPSSSDTAPATRAATGPTARPEPPRPKADRARPSRSRDRASGAGGGAGPLRAAPVGGDVRVERPRRTSDTVAARPARPQAAIEAFQGMLRTGLPTWLLAGIVVLCAIGTVVVVRSAGRRSPVAHHRR